MHDLLPKPETVMVHRFIITGFIASVMGIFIIHSPLPPLASANPDKTREIRNLGHEWVTRYRSGDIDRFMEMYTDDAFVALNGKPALKGKEAIRSYFLNRIGDQAVDIHLEYEKIEINQDIAIVIARFRFSFEKDGILQNEAGRSLLIYKWSGIKNRWLINVDIDQKTAD